METATFTRKEITHHRGNHLGCQRPARELKLHRAVGSSRVVPVLAEEQSTPTKAASEPPSHNYTMLERSLPLYLLIHVYTEILGCTGTRLHGRKCWPCCLLQVAALTGVTRERSTTGKGTTRFREVKLPAVAALTSPWWGN